MPEKGKNDILKFNNFHRKMKVPFVIYADFETIIKKIDDASKTSTKQMQEHTRTWWLDATDKLNRRGYIHVGVKTLINTFSMR